MKLKCPLCGASFDLAQAEAGGLLADLARAEAAFGPDWPLVSEYLDGFKARPDGRLALKKRLRLARELWGMWEKGRFCVGGVWYEIGREEFRAALANVANRELTGLKNHNYLKEVLKAAARETSRRKERELQDWEDNARSGFRGNKPVAAPEKPDDLPTDPAWRKKLSRLLWASLKGPKADRERARVAYQEHLAQGRKMVRGE